LAGTPQGLRWVDVVAALDAAVGAVLLVAGVYLIEPSMLDLGLYLEADRYLLAGLVFAYVGLVFTYAGLLGLAAPGEGFVSGLASALFGTVGRLCVAAMMLTFAVRAGGAGLPMPWIALPAGAGLLAMLSVPFAAIARARSAVAAAAAADHTITADSGKSAPFLAASYLRNAATFVVTVSVSVFVLGLALIAYVLLDRAFIEGRTISLTVAAEVVGRTLVPMVVVVGQLMVALFLIGGAASWFGERRRRRDKDGLERDLSPEEVSFAAACVQQVRDYVAAQGLAAAARQATSMWVWVIIGLGLIALWLLWDGERALAQTYAPPSEAWQFYLIDVSGTTFAALALLTSLAFVPQAVLKLVSRRAAEASGASMLKADRTAGQLEGEIVKRVRDRSLTPGTPFDAGELMRTWGITTAVIALVWNVLLAGGVAVWWPHERARDTLFTEEGIETGDFWTMERTVHRYDAVLAAHPMCDGDGDIGYAIVLPGDLRRALLSESGFRSRLDDVVKIDGKLRAAGVKFVFALPEDDSSDGDVVDRLCVIDLTRDMDEGTRAKVEQVLHLDEWFERRWRQRTGNQPRISSR
jgi:hypothetical protein